MNIEDLIPQREPIIMVDKLIQVKNGVATTQLEVRQDNFFVEDDHLAECGIIEHMAQSAAARMGYLFKKEKKINPIGYIGSINSFQLRSLPIVGETITTSIELVHEAFNLSLVEAKSKVDSRDIATCRMKLYIEQ